ncbi:WD40/YVTN/BNR-like repeat-containing protein [Paenibacillus antarcticus]|uniref:Photosynthesis system II assembly factor Ycf48/Hcf136-like domain-containing protein n=1 Tax=Paenibacillus antarcticus TaxID=253703 RepID=A0A168QGG5_9BACL|nr:hypothetical protein [Paenibacillus antarcticus]OAB47759.1 hypothetical protein PBAT_04495 [Paenibacillus antarcticus]
MDLKKKRINHLLRILVIVVLLLPSGSIGSGTLATATSASICGKGDHGLLQQLQKQHQGEGQSALSFTDIQFLNDHIGRASGNGFIIGTSDGGCHWQEIYTGQWQIVQIDFSDNKNGWALATLPSQQKKYLIQTSDGGSHWKNVNTTITFDRIDLLNDQEGFGYTATSAYKTVDGGKSFSRIPTPVNNRYASFNNMKTGWSIVVIPSGGYKVMKTVDGGKHWSLKLKVAADSNYGGEIYSNGNQVWALLYGEAGMSQVSYSLYGSTDGGSHWNRVIAQDTAGGGPAPGSGKPIAQKGPASPGGHPGNMQLIDNDMAFLAGGSPAGDVVSVGRSYNGEKSWTNITPSIEGYDARISFTNSKKGWLAVVNSSDKSAVYMTKDGGVSWNVKFSLMK